MTNKQVAALLAAIVKANEKMLFNLSDFLEKNEAHFELLQVDVTEMLSMTSGLSRAKRVTKEMVEPIIQHNFLVEVLSCLAEE